MSKTEWKECTIGDIADVQTGPFGSQLHEKDYVSAGTPIVTVEHLGNRTFSTQNLPMVSDSDKSRLQKYCMKQGDLIFSRVGSVDRCTYANENNEGWLFSGRCLRVRPQECVDSMWLYYFFCLESTKTFIRNIAVGATMPSINTKLMCEVSVKYPPLAEQQRIAKILSALDDKIELNNAINRNLEEQAQALFKNWFVDFEPFGGKMPEDWTIGKLSDIADITMGQSPDGKSYNENGDGVVFYQGRAEFGWRFPTRRLFTTAPSRMAKKYDILMSVRAPVGDLNIANEDCCIGRGLAAIHSKDDHQSFVYYTMKALKPKLDMYNGEGTVFGCINRESLNNMEIMIPSKELLVKFEQNVSVLDAEVSNRSNENRKLTNLRNLILPRLMTRELI